MLPTSPTSAVGSFKRSDSNGDLTNTHADHGDFPQLPHALGGRQPRSSIDYSKFKTRTCRHYLMGNQCPFEDRCAFLHGEAPPTPPSSANAHHRRAPPPSFQDYQSSGNSSPVKAANILPPPPSYMESLASQQSSEDSPRDSSPATPPSYPTRFRYEPYSAAGIIYEH